MGGIAARLHQPSSIGELLAGVVLAVGIAVLPFEAPLISGLGDSRGIEVIAEAGIFFLLLLAGLELEPAEIAAHSKESFAVAAGGMLLPLASGFALGWAVLPESDFKQAQALVIGIALSISAIPVAAKVFMELGLLHKPVGEIVIAAAVIDDVAGLLLLAIAAHMITAGSLPDLGAVVLLLGKLVVFFVVTIVIGAYGYKRIWAWLHLTRMPAVSLSTLVIMALAFGLLAEGLGLHFVLGPFVGGLFFEKASVGAAVYDRAGATIRTLTQAVLGPIFFASIGLRLDIQAVTVVPVFLAALVAVAFLGKLAGAGLPAYWSGLGVRNALAIGVGLSGRGAVELVIASIAEKSGVFAVGDGGHPILANLFSALVITAVVTTLIVPIGLHVLLGRSRDSG